MAPTGVFQDCLWAILWAWLSSCRRRRSSPSSCTGTTIAKRSRLLPTASVAARAPGQLTSSLPSRRFFLYRPLRHVVYRPGAGEHRLRTPTPATFCRAVYMTYKSGDFFIRSIEITIALATLRHHHRLFSWRCSTCFCAFRRSTRVDNDFTLSLRASAAALRPSASTIVRGTPPIGPGVLLIYYAGFTVLCGMGFETAQANQICSTFTAGLVTISAQLHRLHDGGPARRPSSPSIPARPSGTLHWAVSRWRRLCARSCSPQSSKNAIPARTNELIININWILLFGYRRAFRTTVRYYHGRRRVLPPDGGLLRGARGLPDPDARGELRLLEAFGKKLDAEAPATLPSSN